LKKFLAATVLGTPAGAAPYQRAAELYFDSIESLQTAMASDGGQLGLGYNLHFWRTAGGLEVDFVLYGERGLKAFEVTRSSRVRTEDFASLRVFLEDYPMAEAWLAYGGTRSYREGKVRVLPLDTCLRRLPDLL